MCNVTIAKDNLQRLKKRTQKDLYRLKYGLENFLPLNEETLLKVKLICNSNDIECPLYKYNGKIGIRHNTKTPICDIFHRLAENHKVYLDCDLI